MTNIDIKKLKKHVLKLHKIFLCYVLKTQTQNIYTLMLKDTRKKNYVA